MHLSLKHLLACLILIHFIIGCSNKQAEETNSANALHLAFFNSIRTLDPAYSSNEDEMFVVQQLFDGLVDLDDSGKVIPSLAKSWDISTDGLTYTFHLHSDAYFQDNVLFLNNKGRKLRASDVVNSFNRIARAALISPGQWIFKSLNRSAKTNYKGMQDINDSTVCIYLNTPDNAFLSYLALSYCSIIPIEVAEYYGPNFGFHPVGSGAYQLKNWIQKERLVLTANDKSREDDTTKNGLVPEAIIIQLALTKVDAFNQFLSGGLDWVFELDERFLNEMITKNGELATKFQEKFTLYRPAIQSTCLLSFCEKTNEKALANRKTALLRKAIQLSIDRERLQLTRFNNLGTATSAAFIPTYWINQASTNQIANNKAEALQMLEKAGYNEANLPPVILLGTTREMEETANFIREELAEISIDIKLIFAADDVLAAMMQQGDVDMILHSVRPDFSDPSALVEKLLNENKCLTSSMTQLQKTFDSAKMMVERKQQLEMYQGIQNELCSSALVVPLFFSRPAWLISQKFTPPFAYSKASLAVGKSYKSKH